MTKKEDELRNKIYRLNDKLGNARMWIFWTAFIVIAFSVVIHSIIGLYNPMVDRLDIDKDLLARDYVLEHYPEFENCTIQYDDCINSDKLICPRGVKIFCQDSYGNRNGLKESLSEIPTKILYFDDITIKEIFEIKINEFIENLE